MPFSLARHLQFSAMSARLLSCVLTLPERVTSGDPTENERRFLIFNPTLSGVVSVDDPAESVERWLSGVKGDEDVNGDL